MSKLTITCIILAVVFGAIALFAFDQARQIRAETLPSCTYTTIDKYYPCR